MPLRPLTVLTYTPGKPGAASRLVDVGDSLAAPAAPNPHGVYQTLRLAPSARLLAWAREGARFELSRTGAAALDQEDIAYLEAYLLSQGSRWNDAEATHGGHP
ncbi:hydrogenase [Achromobacter anxifer]